MGILSTSEKKDGCNDYKPTVKIPMKVNGKLYKATKIWSYPYRAMAGRKIQSVTCINDPDGHPILKETHYKGISIQFDDGDQIFAVISSMNDCCEKYGVYLLYENNVSSHPDMHPANLDDYKEIDVGSMNALLSDKEIANVRIRPEPTFNDYATHGFVVELKNGTHLQLLACNDHEGFYPHTAVLYHDGKYDEESV